MAVHVSSSKPLVRIGLFGPKDCGKTCAITAMAWQRKADGISISITDEATARVIQPLVKSLDQGKVPEATAVGAFNNLRFTVVTGDEKIEVETIDYAGEYTNPVSDEPGVIHADLMAWMAQCDAIMLFVNGVECDPGHFDAYDAIIKVIDDSPHSRSLILVVTKIDKSELTREDVQIENANEPTPRSSDALAKLYKNHRVLELVDSHLDLRDQQNRVHESGGISRRGHRFERILTSSFGWHFFPPKPGDERKLEPCAVLLALRKAAVSGNACRLERRKRQRTTLIVSIAAILLLAWIGLRMHYSGVLTSYTSSVDIESESDVVEYRIAKYQREIGPYRSYFSLLGLEEKAASAQRRYDDDVNAKEKRIEFDKQRLQSELLETQKRNAHIAFTEFIASDATLAPDDPARTSRAHDFLNQWKSSLDEQAINAIEDIATAPPVAQDLNKWNQLKAIPVDSNSPYKAKAALLVKYAENSPPYGHVEESRRLADDLIAQHQEDEKEFSEFIAVASSPANWSKKQNIYSAFEGYCKSRKHSRVMAPTLANYLKKLDDFLCAEHSVEIAITDLSMKKTLASAGASQGTPRIAIRLGGHEDSYTAPAQKVSTLAPYGTNRAAHTRIPFNGYVVSLTDGTPLEIEFEIELADPTLEPFPVHREFAPWHDFVNKDLDLGEATISLVCELPKPPLPPKFIEK